MKRILFLLLISGISLTCFAQEAEKASIEKAIRSGDAQSLSVYFVPTIDLMIRDLEDVYSRDQAQQILSRFFTEHKPVNFVIRHEGKSKSDDFYYIGQLETTTGEFRISFFLKKGEGKFLVKQFRIEDT